jgi:hypothetical protein
MGLGAPHSRALRANTHSHSHTCARPGARTHLQLLYKQAARRPGLSPPPPGPFTSPPALGGVEQSLLASRLGPAALFNARRPTGHWLLDTSHPGHMEVARKLAGAAVAAGGLPNMWNLRIRGARPRAAPGPRGRPRRGRGGRGRGARALCLAGRARERERHGPREPAGPPAGPRPAASRGAPPRPLAGPRPAHSPRPPAPRPAAPLFPRPAPRARPARAGARKAVNENQNLWGVLTADSPTPLLEFDYLGPDAWEALGKSAAEAAAMGPGDRLELRARQARERAAAAGAARARRPGRRRAPAGRGRSGPLPGRGPAARRRSRSTALLVPGAPRAGRPSRRARSRWAPSSPPGPVLLSRRGPSPRHPRPARPRGSSPLGRASCTPTFPRRRASGGRAARRRRRTRRSCRPRRGAERARRGGARGARRGALGRPLRPGWEGCGRRPPRPGRGPAAARGAPGTSGLHAAPVWLRRPSAPRAPYSCLHPARRASRLTPLTPPLTPCPHPPRRWISRRGWRRGTARPGCCCASSCAQPAPAAAAGRWRPRSTRLRRARRSSRQCG